VSSWMPGRSCGIFELFPMNKKANTTPATTTTTPAIPMMRVSRRRLAALRLSASRCRRASSLRAWRFGPAGVPPPATRSGRDEGARGVVGALHGVLVSVVPVSGGLVSAVLVSAVLDRGARVPAVPARPAREEPDRDDGGGRQVLPFFAMLQVFQDPGIGFGNSCSVP
jgi:hypothetical protein